MIHPKCTHSTSEQRNADKEKAVSCGETLRRAPQVGSKHRPQPTEMTAEISGESVSVPRSEITWLSPLVYIPVRFS